MRENTQAWSWFPARSGTGLQRALSTPHGHAPSQTLFTDGRALWPGSRPVTALPLARAPAHLQEAGVGMGW